jgi:hypothetical protein
MSDSELKKKVISYLTLGGLVGAPSAAAFVTTFLLVYYSEKEAVHLMRKRKFLLPTIAAMAAGGATAVFVNNFLGPMTN